MSDLLYKPGNSHVTMPPAKYHFLLVLFQLWIHVKLNIQKPVESVNISSGIQQTSNKQRNNNVMVCIKVISTNVTIV
jgi:hypothetical protein